MDDDLSSRMLEIIANTIVGTQELVRIALRGNGIVLPFSEQVNNFYLYNWGDYINGFQIAFLTNWLGDKVANKAANFAERRYGQDSVLYKITDNLRGDGLMNTISGATGSAAVVFAETTGFLTVPDSRDIPAGILGALSYVAVRYFATRKYNSQNIDNSVD